MSGIVTTDHQPVARICILGAESTGKTTLCADLASRLGVPFVPEFGRHYTEAMADSARYRWVSEDFRVIAEGQLRFEDDAARWMTTALICDTNAYTTALFHEMYLGVASPYLLDLAAGRRYDAFVLCDLATPFVQDTTTGLRRDGSQRQWMHDRYLQQLELERVQHGALVIHAVGTRAERVDQVNEALAPLLATRV